MKKIATYFMAFVFCLITVVTLTACGKPKITSAYIKSGTLPTTIVKDEELDTSKAVAVVEYSDDTVVEVASADLTFGTIDTSTVGTKQLEVTYEKFTFKVTIKVVATEADVNVITSFSSDLLTEFRANSSAKTSSQEEFYVLNKTHLVGDDNALDFRINAKGVDGSGDIVENLTKVRTTIKIEQVGGTESTPIYTELNEDEVLSIATLDTENSTIDFKETAIGNTYRITVSAVNYDPTYFDAQNPASFTGVFKVVDGYNVYDAKDLSLFDNKNTDNGWTALKQAWFGDNWQSLSPNSLILQASINVEDKYVPAKNFYTQAEVDALSTELKNKTNQTIVGSLKDTANNEQGIYVRQILDDETFNVYGNYFDINCSEVKDSSGNVISTGLSRSVLDSDDKGVVIGKSPSYISSHTPLLRFVGAKMSGTSKVNVDCGAGETSLGQANVYDVYFIGNGERSSNPLASGGIILSKSRGVSFTADNTIQKNFYIGYFTEYGYNLSNDGLNGTEEEYLINEGNPYKNVKAKFLNSKGYNNYNSLFYFWGTPNVYLEHCEYIGAGGPVIIADHVDGHGYQATGEGGFATNINVVDCNLESLVTGEEPWFATYGATPYVKQLTAIDPVYNQAGRTFLTQNEEGTPGFMNMIVIFKYGAKEFSTTGEITRGSLNIFNNIEDYNSYKVNGVLADGSAYYGYNKTMSYDDSDPKNYVYNAKVPKDNLSNANKTGEFGRFESSATGDAVVVTSSPSVTGAGFAQGDYLNVYLSNGFGTMFKIYNK